MKLEKVDIVYNTLWTALFAWLFSRVMMERYDGMYTAPLNNFGDLPFHLGIVTSFAYGDNFPPQNPVFSGINFTYSYLIDLIAALLVKIGLGLKQAFFIENLVLIIAVLLLIQFLTYKLTSNKLAARIAPFVFFFNGGFGFLKFFVDGVNISSALTMNNKLTLFGVEIPLRWGNVITTMLIPQRSLLLGLPLVALIIILWKSSIDRPERRLKYMLYAGICVGLLPLSHAHGFLSVMMVAPVMTLLFRFREWIWFYLIGGLIAMPQVWLLSSTGVKNKAFKFGLWAEYGNAGPFLFWIANAGIFIALIAFYFLYVIKRQGNNSGSNIDSRKFYLPFILWFIVPNIISLAPWSWDNTKVLVYWLLISTPFVAAGIAFLMTNKNIWMRVVACLLFIGLTFSGATDTVRALTSNDETRLFTNVQIEVAEYLRHNTPPHSIILHAPIHNSVNSLAGRLSVMGYPGHLWTHGIDYATREADVRIIFRGEQGAGKLIAMYKIDYVIIGPGERHLMNVNEQFFDDNYKIIMINGDIKVYQVKK